MRALVLHAILARVTIVTGTRAVATATVSRANRIFDASWACANLTRFARESWFAQARTFGTEPVSAAPFDAILFAAIFAHETFETLALLFS